MRAFSPSFLRLILSACSVRLILLTSPPLTPSYCCLRLLFLSFTPLRAGVPKGTLAENVARVEAKEKIAAEAKAKAEVPRPSLPWPCNKRPACPRPVCPNPHAMRETSLRP